MATSGARRSDAGAQYDAANDWPTAATAPKQTPPPRETSISAHQVLMISVQMSTADLDELGQMLMDGLKDGFWQRPRSMAVAREFIEATEGVR